MNKGEMMVQGVEKGDRLKVYIQSWDSDGKINHIHMLTHQIDFYELISKKVPSLLEKGEDVWSVLITIENDRLAKSNYEGNCDLCSKDMSKCAIRPVEIPSGKKLFICGTCHDVMVGYMAIYDDEQVAVNQAMMAIKGETPVKGDSDGL